MENPFPAEFHMQDSPDLQQISDKLFLLCLKYSTTGESSFLDEIQVLAACLKLLGYVPKYFQRQRCFVMNSELFKAALEKQGRSIKEFFPEERPL